MYECISRSISFALKRTSPRTSIYSFILVFVVRNILKLRSILFVCELGQDHIFIISRVLLAVIFLRMDALKEGAAETQAQYGAASVDFGAIYGNAKG